MRKFLPVMLGVLLVASPARAEDQMPAPPAMPVEKVDGEAENFVEWETPPAYLLTKAEGAKTEENKAAAAKEEPAKEEPVKEELAKEVGAEEKPAEAEKTEATKAEDVKMEEAPAEAAAATPAPATEEAPDAIELAEVAGAMEQGAEAEAPAAAPVRKAVRSIPVPLPRPMIPGVTLPEGAEIPIVDTDETLPLPPYPPGARRAAGKEQTYTLGEEDTLLDVARHYRLGFVELRAANPEIDPWTPVPGEEVLIPGFRILPRAPQSGVVVNLAQMRMYVFRGAGKAPLTFPIGIGREGLQTPTGETSIVRKVAGPTWFPTPRMREEKPYLPAAIPPGNQNPLGTHALYLGWPTFLIHGSNKPWAIGRRVSSGCMRLYPEDIKAAFDTIPVGMQVTVVDQPILVAWVGDDLYLEVNASKSQSIDIEIGEDHKEKPLTDAIRKVITEAAGVDEDTIDWDVVKTAMLERRGVPVVIASKGGAEEGADEEASAPKPKKKKKEQATEKKSVPKYN